LQAMAQQMTISGKVTAVEDGSALPGVTVLVKGTDNGVSTNTEGNYSINAQRGQVLVFSFIGTTTQEITVGAESVINVTLGADAKALDEVVVVGYGTQKRANLTGAVSTVDTKVLESRPITDVGRGLQGTTPGLTITTPTGALGQNPAIRLRGITGSLTGSGAEPLILVDNVEIPSLQMINPDDIETISVLKDAASTSIYGARGAWGVILITTKTGKRATPTRVTYSNNFSWSTPTTNPEFASAADASELALLSVTRNGALMAPILGVAINEDAIRKMREWEQQYGGQDLGNEMVLGRDFAITSNGLEFYRSWDPAEEYMRNFTPQQKHDISVSGGSEKTNYNLGIGYLAQQGVLKINPDDFNRYNLNLGIGTSVTDWLDVRSKVLYSNSTVTQPFQFSGDNYDPWFYLYRWPAWFPYGTYEGRRFRNVITEVEQAKMNNDKSTLARVSLGGTLKPLKGLTIDADYTYTRTNGLYHQTGGTVSAYDFWVGGGNMPYQTYTAASYNRALYQNNWSDMNTGKAFATYTKDINDHSFKVIAGGDIESYEYWLQRSERRDLLDPEKGELNLATGDQFVSSDRNTWTTLGFFGRINYSFKNKYLLEVNGRYDGSSRLSKAQKWGFFPSMSAGYIISEEPFMKSVQPVLSFLKFRGSYGSVGNQNASINNIYSTMAAGNSGWLVGGKNLLQVGTPTYISSALTWETVSTLDFGMDSKFFDNRFGLNFDWYQRTVSGMHSPGITVPSTLGTGAPRRNYGEMQTTGWELELNFNHAFSNGLNFNVTGMLSDFQEKITKYANTSTTIPDPISGRNATLGRWYEGMVLGEIWGYETDRFFTQDDFEQDASGKLVLKPGIPSQARYETGGFFYGPGDIKYKDLNGDGVINNGANTVDDHGDMKKIGNSTPRYQYGLRVGADWKGFDLNFFFQGVGKRDLWASGPIFIPGFRAAEATFFDHQLDYWTPENPDAYYPRPTNAVESNNARNFLIQTKYLLDMSYLRMKNITFGYTLPASLTNKIRLERVRVYGSGENLFELDNLDIPIDPEVDFTQATLNDPAGFGRVYPYRRSFSFGVQITL